MNGSSDATPHAPPAPSRLAHLRWLVPVVFLAAVAWLVTREIGRFDLAAMQTVLLAVPTTWSLALALFALGAVAFTGLADLVIARWLGIPRPARDVLRLAFVANALANTLNFSGAIGPGVRLLGYGAAPGAPPAGSTGRTAALIGLQVLSLPLGLSVLVIVMLATRSLPITPDAAIRWLALAVLVGAALYLPAFYILTGRRRLMRWLPQGQGLPPWRLKLALTVVSFIDWLLAAAVLYACLYLSGVHVKPGPLIASFAGAAVLGLVSMVPGGFGVFDGLMAVALTSGGYDAAKVSSGLFLFRIAYYLLPLMAGLYLGSGLLPRGLPALSRAADRLRTHPLFGILGLPASLLADLGIRILAALTFLAGFVLLASAVIPAVHQRMAAVHEVLPLAATESSYWLSIVAGVVLLGLGRGIAGRLRVAYRATTVLLVVAAALAVTKGLHFGEALFLLAIAALLRTRKGEFSQRAMSLTSATTFTWYAGLALVVAAFFAAGLAAAFDTDSFDLWAFGAGAHSPRLARGLAAALIGLVAYLVWQSSAVKRPDLHRPGHVELERARTVYAAHGGGEFAHLTFMGDKPLFWSADGQAVLAYGVVRDRRVALGSPAGPPGAVRRALLDFRRFADEQDRVPVFYEVLEPELSQYHDLGFDLFKLGELATIRLAEFSLAGKRWEDLRQAVNRAAKEGLAFELAEPPFDTVLLADVERVSDAWLAERGAREKGFSLGRFEPAYLAWSPLALVRRDGVLVAFANVQPPYGDTATASVDMMRQVADAPRGTMDFLFANVMRWAREHGCRNFSLGMAPLASVGDNPYARINERLAALAFRYGGRFYNYQGLRRYKQKFDPQWTGAYLAYPRGLWVPGLLIDIAALVEGGYRKLLLPGRQ
ncbi:MAG: bifunctional lysylphosphatidylglycerol flippase/synthetase MprF [Lysobacterales bacterium]